MRHALNVERPRLLIAVNAGRAKRRDAAGVAEEEDDILGMLLAQQDARTEEKGDEQDFSKHSFRDLSAPTDCRTGADAGQALTPAGRKPMACGWLTDKFGLCWQIVPEFDIATLEAAGVE